MGDNNLIDITIDLWCIYGWIKSFCRSAYMAILSLLVGGLAAPALADIPLSNSDGAHTLCVLGSDGPHGEFWEEPTGRNYE